MNNRGKYAELKATEYLKKKHYKLVDYNYSCKFGEIDIIVKNKKYIVFVEVKMRDENSIASPKEFVTYSKQQKMIAAAQMYLMRNPTDLQPRFDVIEVICKDGKIKSVKHLENAFQLD
ncbi:MAG: YraN family protein [Eubacterium sp.]|nr:YraN family protein [Eubacterium sp.]MBR0413338.1 YraN family protein [Eubacterium sp.]